MIRTDSSPTRLVRLPAIGLALVLGGLLLAGLFALLGPHAAAAAGLAEPAANYPCTLAGLNSALAAGGSATFACGAPTTVTVTSRKNVPHNLSIDGTNLLVIKGISTTGLFTVPVGIHLSLLNLTLRDGEYGAIDNSGVLNINHVHFISNTQYAVWNEGGSAASVSNSSIEGGFSKAGQLINGDFGLTQTAALTVVNSVLHDNVAGNGAAIANLGGTAYVSGSNFYQNRAYQGGAIWNRDRLTVDNSQFTYNLATSAIFDSQVQSRLAQPGPAEPQGFDLNVGGAIFNDVNGNLIVASSAFSQNFATHGGGAIMFGYVPLGSTITPTAAQLTIADSTFDYNCTGGPGGAVAASQKTIINSSSFSHNVGDSGPLACILFTSNQPNAPAAGGPDLAAGLSYTLPANVSGAGGAVFSSDDLQVDGSHFLNNTTAITSGGGGGAIENFAGGALSVANSTFGGNTALTAGGGAIFNGLGSTALIQASDFHDNQSVRLGGAIGNVGRLTVSYSSFSANSNSGTSFGGGAIFSGNTGGPAGPTGPNETGENPASPADLAPELSPPPLLNVDHSTFISNSSVHEGGALDAGPALIVDSSFMSNTAPYGGAIDVWAAPVTVTGSSFMANAAAGNIHIPAEQGGAIDTNARTTAVINSTFYKNRANDNAVGGAINLDSGQAAITNSTFLSNTANVPANGGAFSANGNLVVRNVLLGFNSSPACTNAITLNSHDLEYPSSSCGGGATHLDPRALAPADNGGPTFTSALLAGSPAINAGDNSGCPGSDQRGALRPVGGTCDMGAFEFGGLVARLWLPLVRK